AGFLFFSVSATRLPHYIGPLFPAAAILTACFWQRSLSDPDGPGVKTALFLTIGIGCVMGLALALSPWLYSAYLEQIVKEFPMAAQVSPGWWPFVSGVILLLGMPVVAYYGLI